MNNDLNTTNSTEFFETSLLKSSTNSNSTSSSKYHKRYRVGGIILDPEDNLLVVLGRYSNKWSLPKGADSQSHGRRITGMTRASSDSSLCLSSARFISTW